MISILKLGKFNIVTLNTLK